MPSVNVVPFVTGFALIVAGAALRRWRPSRLALPEPRRALGKPDISDAADVARRLRDAVAAATPPNATVGLSRSLIVMGAGLIVMRAIEEMDDHDVW